ncbi:DNA-binding response regulator [bacterium]|nr:DNA-binding response regulator [Chloroflexi bacterium CFX6]RIL10887.1 MAG: DNA-binding response regulator [bacterium]
MGKRDTRLLIIDDDARLTDAMTLFLSRSGYGVEVAHSGMDGLARFQARPPHLVILDVMMPGMDGWDVCRRLRDQANVPIIMLTARDSENDRVMGLRMGADDYVTKPFSLKELEARVEAVLRRAHAPPEPSRVIHDDGYLRLETGSMQVTAEGRPVRLTATERRLLFLLAQNTERVVAIDEILRLVWGPEYDGQSDYVKLYVWRLRQKVEPDPAAPRYIHTERGLGYRFVGRAPTASPAA